MPDFNQITLVGRLTRDVELKYTPANTAVGSVGMAVNSSWTDATGNKKEDVCSIDITFWGRTAEVAAQYTCKGDPLMVIGALKLESWEDKNGGGKRSKHSVTCEKMVLLGGKRDENQEAQRPSPQQQRPAQGYQRPAGQAPRQVRPAGPTQRPVQAAPARVVEGYEQDIPY